MKPFDVLRSLFALEGLHEPGQMRSGDTTTDYDTQLAEIVSRRSSGAYRIPTVREAMGVPGIFRAVSLIANTTGRLVPKAYRYGQLLAQTAAPQIVLRPNPRTTPRAFYRDSAYYLATRGECWWWVARRDGDGNPLSLVVVPPWEVIVEPNDFDRLRPTVKWLNKTIRNEDMRQITFLTDDANTYRGIGPLQLCGAAASVAVEAQQWAANFFAGGVSTQNIFTSVDMAEADAQALKAQWLEATPNLPRIIPPDVEKIEDDSPDPAKAQMTETRKESKGDAATMFGIPGALLEYAQSGTSLTYQNVEDIWRNFQEGCLTPNYLEPIEQEMSDLLPRSTISHFDLAQLLRSQPLTRAQIYNLLIPLGVMTAEQAGQAEGFIPGDAEYMPTPFSSPAAQYDRLPIVSRSADPIEVRCSGQRWHNGRLAPCNRMLGRLVPPYEVLCPRCGTMNKPAA